MFSDVAALFDFLFFLSDLSVLLLVVISGCIATGAIYFSSLESKVIRLFFLIVLMILCLMISYYADDIFDELNAFHYYDEYFSNLFGEFLGALLVFPLIINAWSYQRVGLSLLVALMFFVVGMLLIQFDPAPLFMLGGTPYDHLFMTSVFEGLGYEVLSGVAMSLLVCIVLSVYLSFYHSVWNILYAIVSLIIVSFWVWMIVNHSPQMQEPLLIATFGAFSTMMIISSWVIYSFQVFAVIAGLVFVASTLILFNIEADVLLIAIPDEIAFELSAELIGALAAGILINRHWFWNERIKPR